MFTFDRIHLVMWVAWFAMVVGLLHIAVANAIDLGVSRTIVSLVFALVYVFGLAGYVIGEMRVRNKFGIGWVDD